MFDQPSGAVPSSEMSVYKWGAPHDVLIFLGEIFMKVQGNGCKSSFFFYMVHGFHSYVAHSLARGYYKIVLRWSKYISYCHTSLYLYIYIYAHRIRMYAILMVTLTINKNPKCQHIYIYIHHTWIRHRIYVTYPLYIHPNPHDMCRIIPLKNVDQSHY